MVNKGFLKVRFFYITLHKTVTLERFTAFFLQRCTAFLRAASIRLMERSQGATRSTHISKSKWSFHKNYINQYIAIKIAP